MQRVDAAANLAWAGRHGGGHRALDEARGHRVDSGTGLGEERLEGVDKPDDARLGGGVVGLAAVSGNTRHGGHAHNGCARGEVTIFDELLGDTHRCQEVDGQHCIPLAFVHVGQQLVASDAGVVDDNVDGAAVAILRMLGDGRGGTGIRDVERQRRALHLVGSGAEVLAGARNIDANNVCAIASEDLRDGGSDSARSARDHG